MKANVCSWHGRGTALALIAVALFGCSESTPAPAPDLSGTFFGPRAVIAGGTARAYVTLDRVGKPTDLGVALTEASLADLPVANTEYVISLPPEASSTPFRHAVINWIPNGHAPAMIYMVPHFDFHFYMITDAERSAIVLGDSALAAKMARQPTAEFVPAGYVIGMAAAGMGLHWNDPDAPERHGEPFTKTFIYGSYDGVFTFAEPMVTKEFLETRPTNVVTPVKLPAQWASRGYQATSYTISYSATTKEYNIALSALTLR